MSGAAAGLNVLGGAVNASAAIHEGQNAVAMHEYNYKTDIENASLARETADEDSRRAMVISRKHIGAGIAAVGASGIQRTGSAIDVLAASAAAGELDARTIKYKGSLKAYGYEQDAQLERYKSGIARENADMKAMSAILNAGSSAATSASSSGE